MNTLQQLRSVLMIPLFIGISCGQADAQDDKIPEKQYDTITVSQIDGTELKVVGFGKLHLAYTETIDGYTIVRNNQGIYEYAEQASDGGLEPSGVKARNPGEREEEELRFLRNMEKHLRYESPRLDELKEKQDRMFRIFGREKDD